MSVSDAQKRASAKYNKEKTRLINIRLMLSSDADILDHLDKLPNKQGYIKSLIRADMELHPIPDVPAQNLTKCEEEKSMKTWYIIDDLDATPIRAKSEDDAARIMRETWLALSEHDRAKRTCFYTALCAKDDDGCVDLDSAEHAHDAADADQVMLMHYNELLREMTERYRSVLESDGQCQYKIYIWSDGEIECLEGQNGDSTRLAPRSCERRSLYYVTTIAAPCVDVFDLAFMDRPDDPAELEADKAEAIDCLVNAYDEEAEARLDAAIAEACEFSHTAP